MENQPGVAEHAHAARPHKQDTRSALYKPHNPGDFRQIPDLQVLTETQ